ncbi:MAG: alpha/beta hydrolase [Chlamydiota bacterium]
MGKTCFWTPSGARLQLVRSVEGQNLNWLFLPGGPGLGSESLLQLLNILELPGNMWCLDLPGDGSNTTSNNKEAFSHLFDALFEAVTEFKNVILVAHSTGGMYALSTPKIEPFLKGLILLDSAPDAVWQRSFEEMVRNCPIFGMDSLQEKYLRNPNNETLKELTIASSPYLFTKEGFNRGIEMLSSLPYNYESCQWSDEHFDRTYQSKWVPQTIPTLILTGEQDLIIPLRMFTVAKQFHRDNIVFRSIRNAGHFPWIDNPVDVVAEFEAFCTRLDIL